MSTMDTSGPVNPIIRGQLTDLPDDVFEATQRSHDLAEGIDFQCDSVFTTPRLVQWFMGSLTLFIGALSVKGFLGAAGLLGSVAVYEKFLWLVICILMGGVAVLTGRQAFRSAAHAKALKDGPHRLGLFLSPRWLLVHRMVDVTYIPVSHIRSIENVIVRSGGPGSSGAARVRVVYVLQTVDDNAPPLATLDRPGYAVHLDCPSSPHIYDWWRDVQARRAADS